jgi:hypothetical protein
MGEITKTEENVEEKIGREPGTLDKTEPEIGEKFEKFWKAPNHEEPNLEQPTQPNTDIGKSDKPIIDKPTAEAVVGIAEEAEKRGKPVAAEGSENEEAVNNTFEKPKVEEIPEKAEKENNLLGLEESINDDLEELEKAKKLLAEKREMGEKMDEERKKLREDEKKLVENIDGLTIKMQQHNIELSKEEKEFQERIDRIQNKLSSFMLNKKDGDQLKAA